MRLLFFSLIAISIPASASTIVFSDLGTGSSVYSTGPGAIVKGNGPGVGGNNISQAREFTVAGIGDFTITQIDFAVLLNSGVGTFQASIWTSSSGLPDLVSSIAKSENSSLRILTQQADRGAVESLDQPCNRPSQPCWLA